jgi:hypothetical protein
MFAQILCFLLTFRRAMRQHIGVSDVHIHSEPIRVHMRVRCSAMVIASADTAFTAYAPLAFSGILALIITVRIRALLASASSLYHAPEHRSLAFATVEPHSRASIPLKILVGVTAMFPATGYNAHNVQFLKDQATATSVSSQCPWISLVCSSVRGWGAELQGRWGGDLGREYKLL